MQSKTLYLLIFCFFSSLVLPSCFRMRASKGGGQISTVPQRNINPGNIALPAGYKIEAVLTGLNFPSAATFDDKNSLYVIETGYSYGEVWSEPRLLKVNPSG